MAVATHPKCPFCKQREAVEVYAKYIYPKNPAVWPGKPLAMHRIYLCPCGQKFTKKIRRRGRML